MKNENLIYPRDIQGSMQECIFCHILRKQIPAHIVYEDSKTLAFLDINPAAEGHCLVIPKTHYAKLHELSKEDAAALGSTLAKVAAAISKLSPNYNLLQNNGEEAGQVVHHVHFHIAPRTQQEGIFFKTSRKQLSESEMKLITKKIKKSLKE